MTRNRVRVGGSLAGVLLLASLTGCGGDPAPKGDDPSPSSPTISSGSTPPDPSESTFPPDAPLANGSWIPSPSLRIKVPRGFKGEAEFGVTTLRKGDLAITIFDPGLSGDSDLDAAIKTEKHLGFTAHEKLLDKGSATVDGQEVQVFVMTGDYEFFQRISYGFGVTDGDGDTRFVVLGFEGEKDPTTQQDTIDSVLASIQWNKRVVG
jgi:hypothetical protein